MRKLRLRKLEVISCLNSNSVVDSTSFQEQNPFSYRQASCVDSHLWSSGNPVSCWDGGLSRNRVQLLLAAGRSGELEALGGEVRVENGPRFLTVGGADGGITHGDGDACGTRLFNGIYKDASQACKTSRIECGEKC